MGNAYVYNIGTLATPEGFSARRGKDQGMVRLIHNCSVLIRGGIIEAVGDVKAPESGFEMIDAGGALVTPGLIDCHTHLVFGGWRHKEFPLKLAGASYLEILESGGGILSTVGHTRNASIGELYKKAKEITEECADYGVTTLEAKSGYGLDLENELKCLEVVKKLNEDPHIDLVSTFMGAHAVPGEYKNDRKAYVRLVCEEMLPETAKRGLAEYCDVFCEKGAFDIAESRQILETAKNLGLKLKIHAEEINNLGGAALAAELGCESAEHLIKISAEGITALANSPTVAVCLPCTSFYLNEDFAPAKKIISEGGAVAVATDFNPGSSPNYNIQLAMEMACYKYRLSPEEALTAVTLNAAAAIGRAGSAGSAEAGKKGDLVIWKARELSEIFYRYGTNLAAKTIKTGVSRAALFKKNIFNEGIKLC